MFKTRLKNMKTLEELLYRFGSKKPFDKYGEFTKNGIKAYNRMYEFLCDISILTEINMRDICQKLDEISNKKYKLKDMSEIKTKKYNDYGEENEPNDVIESTPNATCPASTTTTCKPYWIIQKELEDELNKITNTQVETEYCEKGTVSRFCGKIIGYNMSYEDIISYISAQKHALRYNRGEILMYESCLFNLHNDNAYENIRSILKKIRMQIGLYRFPYY